MIIHAIATHVPPLRLRAADTLALLPALAGGADQAAQFASVAERTGIQERAVTFPIDAFSPDGGPGRRARLYREGMETLAEAVAGTVLGAARVDPATLTLLMTASCTGYLMPSVDVYLITRLGLPARVRRVPITTLGCSAGVAAVAATREYLESSSGVGLVVLAELSSTCVQTVDVDRTDVIANLLFADGAAAAVVGPGTLADGPEIVATRSVLWPDSTELLGMRMTDTGLRLVLSPDLPDAVGRYVGATIDAFLADHGIARRDVAFWAIHPGGPKVLDAATTALDVSPDRAAPSWAIWRRHGNMSSTTIFFILEEVAAMQRPPAGSLGVVVAFGPGVSCEMLLLRAGGWLSDVRTSAAARREPGASVLGRRG